MCCSSDRYTFKAQSGGHFGCSQTGCEAQSFTKRFVRSNFAFSPSDRKDVLRTAAAFGAYSSNILKTDFLKSRCGGDFHMRALMTTLIFFLIGLMPIFFALTVTNIFIIRNCVTFLPERSPIAGENSLGIAR